MYAVGNFEKFFDDHPEHAALKDSVLAEVRRRATTGCRVSGGTSIELLGPDIGQKFDIEVGDSAEHQEIFVNTTINAK